MEYGESFAMSQNSPMIHELNQKHAELLELQIDALEKKIWSLSTQKSKWKVMITITQFSVVETKSIWISAEAGIHIFFKFLGMAWHR